MLIPSPKLELCWTGDVHDALPLPQYATEGSSGMDLQANEDCVLYPFRPLIVTTGWSLGHLSPGYELQIRSRSGNTYKRSFLVANSPGTIDSDYRGPINVILMSFVHHNDPFSDALDEGVRIQRGDRIAQMIVCPIRQILPVVVSKDSTTNTARGTSGFGSTGQ